MFFLLKQRTKAPGFYFSKCGTPDGRWDNVGLYVEDQFSSIVVLCVHSYNAFTLFFMLG